MFDFFPQTESQHFNIFKLLFSEVPHQKTWKKI